MRTKYSIYNSISSFLSSICTMLAGFISQAIFIKILGTEYLGLNGLFTNILTILSFFELGIGSAIVYNLYKPISANDIDEIKSIMQFYKKSYTVIAALVFLFGIVVLPFLPIFVKETNIDINVNYVYLLFLINTSSSYLLLYKINLIQANQKAYITNIVHILYTVILNIIQILFLIYTKNYYLYLIIKIVCQLTENVINSLIANRLFPYLKEKDAKKIDKNIVDDIIKKIKGLLFHKVGNSIVNGTDNIIISSFLGLSMVGLYSSYNLIINAVNTLFRQIIISTTSSVGNLIASTKSVNQIYNLFKKIRFINFILSTLSSICILLMVNPFITIWIGEKYLLSVSIVFVLVINYFQKMQRCAYNSFKDAAGIWYEDRYVPVIESILNITFSIFLLKIFGLVGVFVGTIVSGMVLWLYSYPKFVYKKLFNRSYLEYYKETFGYLFLFILLSFATYFISTFFLFNSIWVQLFVNALLSITIPSLILFLIFRKNDNFKYFCDLLIKIIRIKNR